MNRSDNIHTIGEALSALVRSLGIGTQVEQYRIFDVWAEAVGEQIAKVAAPERIRNGVLVVKVNNAPWRTELTFRKRELLEKIHAATQSTSIVDITFR